MPTWKYATVLLDNQTLPQFRSSQQRTFSGPIPGEVLSVAEKRRRDAYGVLYDDGFTFRRNVHINQARAIQRRLEEMGLIAFAGVRAFLGRRGKEDSDYCTILARRDY
ncbi:hypothetical protein HYT24_03060 [Candidatus Pacearchaeota archaeon]|nr:hypothetical protein [Candidatus Pacearchaeota archaeon]